MLPKIPGKDGIVVCRESPLMYIRHIFNILVKDREVS